MTKENTKQTLGKEQFIHIDGCEETVLDIYIKKQVDEDLKVSWIITSCTLGSAQENKLINPSSIEFRGATAIVDGVVFERSTYEILNEEAPDITE